MISGLFIFMIGSKVSLTFAWTSSFSRIHHRFHQYDQLRHFLTRTMIWFAKVWINSWSWLAKIIDSLKFFNPSFKLEIDSKSKWFVGSSSTRTFDFKEHEFWKHDTNFFPPPDKTFTGLLTSSPEKSIRPRNHVGRYCHLLLYLQIDEANQGLTLLLQNQTVVFWQIRSASSNSPLDSSFIVNITHNARINAVVWISFVQ